MLRRRQGWATRFTTERRNEPGNERDDFPLQRIVPVSRLPISAIVTNITASTAEFGSISPSVTTLRSFPRSVAGLRTSYVFDSPGYFESSCGVVDDDTITRVPARGGSETAACHCDADPDGCVDFPSSPSVVAVAARVLLLGRILLWWPIFNIALIAADTIVNGVETRDRFGKPVWTTPDCPAGSPRRLEHRGSGRSLRSQRENGLQMAGSLPR